MKTLTRLIVIPALISWVAFAGGGSEDVVAELNGWVLRIGGGGGSEAYIERKTDTAHFHGTIQFDEFWDYFLILKGLPRSTNNKPTNIWIADENDKREPNPSYLASEQALPILHLMLLTHRARITSDSPEALEQELNTHSPLPERLHPNANFRFIVKITKANR